MTLLSTNDEENDNEYSSGRIVRPTYGQPHYRSEEQGSVSSPRGEDYHSTITPQELEDLFFRYVQPNIQKLSNQAWAQDLTEHRLLLTSLVRDLNLIVQSKNETEAITFFVRWRLKGLIQALNFNTHLLKESGYMKVLDLCFERVLNSLPELKDTIIEAESAILADVGAKRPQQTLDDLINQLQPYQPVRQKINKLLKGKPVSRSIEHAPVHVKKAFQTLAMQNTKAPKRYFKASSEIGEGALIAMMNAAMGAELLSVSQSGLIALGPSIVSVVTGASKILKGIGEYRGE